MTGTCECATRVRSSSTWAKKYLIIGDALLDGSSICDENEGEAAGRSESRSPSCRLLLRPSQRRKPAGSFASSPRRTAICDQSRRRGRSSSTGEPAASPLPDGRAACSPAARTGCLAQPARSASPPPLCTSGPPRRRPCTPPAVRACMLARLQDRPLRSALGPSPQPALSVWR